MNSTKVKKALLAGLSVVLVAAMAVAGTVAYLQDTSDDVVNTFSTNNVDVELKETTGEDYNIIPGTSEAKDPKVTVDNSVDAYVYVTVMDYTKGLVTYEIADGWIKLDDYDNVYYRKVEANATATEKEFDVLKDNEVSYSAELTNDDMPDGAVTLTFRATAIQADAFEDAAKAYKQIPILLAAADNDSLSSALAEIQGETAEISITNDIDGITGIRTENGTNLNVDFNGNTIKVATPVGSPGTETNGMQLLKGSTNVFTDGTYLPESTNVKLLIQNYSDLTLKDMTLDASGYSRCAYVLSCNYGTTTITGNTNITAYANKYALDVMHWDNDSYGDGVTVIIDENMTGTIDGKIDVYHYGDPNDACGATVDLGPCNYATLIIKGGTFKNTGLDLEKFQGYVADGYKVQENKDDSWTVIPE